MALSAANNQSLLSGTQTPIVYFTLKVATYVLTPYAESCLKTYPKLCRNPGVDSAFLLQVLRSAGINITFLVMEKENDVYKMLYQEKADFLGQTEVLTDYANLTATTVIHSERPMFLVHMFHQENEYTSAMMRFMPFWGWCLLLFMIFLAYGLMISAEVLMKTRFLQSGFFMFLEQKFRSWFCLAHIASGSAFDHLAWLIVSISVGVFGSSLAIFYAQGQKPFQLAFNNLDELSEMLKAGDCKVVTFDHILEDFKELFNESYENPDTRDFQHNIRKNLIIISKFSSLFYTINHSLTAGLRWRPPPPPMRNRGWMGILHIKLSE